jgi:hypothetical protein
VLGSGTVPWGYAKLRGEIWMIMSSDSAVCTGGV